jgi:hypothetical protein
MQVIGVALITFASSFGQKNQPKNQIEGLVWHWQPSRYLKLSKNIKFRQVTPRISEPWSFSF